MIWKQNIEIWSYNATTIEQGMQAFIDAPLFDEKTFWDAEKILSG